MLAALHHTLLRTNEMQYNKQYCKYKRLNTNFYSEPLGQQYHWFAKLVVHSSASIHRAYWPNIVGNKYASHVHCYERCVVFINCHV